MATNHHDYSHQTSEKQTGITKLTFKLVPIVIVLGIIGASCSFNEQLAPAPDCFTIGNVVLEGTVEDSNGHPVPNATIEIISINNTSCSDYPPIEDIVLLSDVEGEFQYIFPILAEDNILQVKVEADGFRSSTLHYVTYASLAEKLEFVLQED